MKYNLSIVTNVSNADLPRIQNILPHWLRVFDSFFDEMLIVYDNNELSGRISGLHGKKYYTPEEIENQLTKLRSLDNRIVIKTLDKNEISQISSIWFKKGAPFRCQNGSPIFPFIYAIHHAKNNFILKCDSDILFYESGFVEEAFSKLASVDIVTPPRNVLVKHIVSSRGFFIDKEKFYKNLLPLKLPKLNIFQIAFKVLRGQQIFDKNKFSFYFGFEDSLNHAVRKRTMTHYRISKQTGNSLHVCTNQEADDPFIAKVVESFENGIWPNEQEAFDMNYSKPIWENFFTNAK